MFVSRDLRAISKKVQGLSAKNTSFIDVCDEHPQFDAFEITLPILDFSLSYLMAQNNYNRTLAA